MHMHVWGVADPLDRRICTTTNDQIVEEVQVVDRQRLSSPRHTWRRCSTYLYTSTQGASSLLAEREREKDSYASMPAGSTSSIRSKADPQKVPKKSIDLRRMYKMGQACSCVVARDKHAGANEKIKRNKVQEHSKHQEKEAREEK